MKRLEAMKAVYCYFFPEVRPLIRASDRVPDRLFLTSTPAEEAEGLLKGLFRNPLEVPATPEGKIDLDAIHEPITDRVVQAYRRLVPSLKGFPCRYLTSGSSPGIFHLLSLFKTQGVDSIYILRGEYEGFSAYAETMNIETREVDPEKDDLDSLEKGVWFISNPSARDGNIIPNEFVNSLCDAGHRVVLDLAYVGLTKPYEFDVSHENVTAVVMSFSKPYGVFRFRIGGFTFSRESIPSLYANKWFKDVPRLLAALKIIEEIPPGGLYRKYRPVQEKIVKDINRNFSLGVKASDALLLGYLTGEDAEGLSKTQLDMIEQFRRGDGYRFCLTPYYEKIEIENETGS